MALPEKSGKPLPCRKMLTDTGILEAIASGDIRVLDPDAYLNGEKRKLISPASMDLVLSEWESVNPISGYPWQATDHLHWHPDLDESFITFWPFEETEILVHDITHYTGTLFSPRVELRSTLRRIGLTIGFNPMGPGMTNEGAFLSVRNTQSYPVSIEKGTKVAQILWETHATRFEASDYQHHPLRIPYAHGYRIDDDAGLRALMDTGELTIPEGATMQDGYLVFHAGQRATRNAQRHIILHADKRTEGIETHVSDTDVHVLTEGEFVDIQTRESFALSDRVGVQGIYFDGREPETRDDVVRRWLTHTSTGGWIDPGYQGAYSVQRKAFFDDLTIKQGDPVALGAVWFYPQGVAAAYDGHYQGAKEFRAVQDESRTSS